ncbi:hypothetical protein [Prosthecobacter sp.]|uniref:hypothetical protein n=1 Tax=Prosthecobacter sp. TaxID=1965333 RepID=UPI003784BC61
MSSYLRPRRPPPSAIAQMILRQKSAAHQRASETAPPALGAPPRKLPPGIAQPQLPQPPPPPKPAIPQPQPQAPLPQEQNQQRINLVQPNATLPRSQPLGPAAATVRPPLKMPLPQSEPKPQAAQAAPVPLRSVRSYEPQAAAPSFSLEEMLDRHRARSGGQQSAAAASSGNPIPQPTTLFQRTGSPTLESFARQAALVKRHGEATGEGQPLDFPGSATPQTTTLFQRTGSPTLASFAQQAALVKRHGEGQAPDFPGKNSATNASLFHRLDAADPQSLPAGGDLLNQRAPAAQPAVVPQNSAAPTNQQTASTGVNAAVRAAVRPQANPPPANQQVASAATNAVAQAAAPPPGQKGQSSPAQPAPTPQGQSQSAPPAPQPGASTAANALPPPSEVASQLQEKLSKAAPGTPMSLLDAATGGTPGSGVKAKGSDAVAARELFMKSMGIADVNHVQLHPQPDGTFDLRSKGNASGTPTATYDPKQHSLTVQAPGGTLSEDTRQMLQNIAVPPGRPGAKPRASDGLPVYFGNGRRATTEEFGALSQAGQQASSTARTPEERAAALDKLGLSPAGIRQQMEAGRISFQQALALNGHFNHVLEHNATLHGASEALNDWGLQPQNKDMGSWLHSGTPEQRAYAINQYFDQTSGRAENNLLTTPERMEELRRRALGEIPGGNPEWGKPGAVSPGREPKDGPAGLLRIPLQGGGAAHIPTGTWTREDYETLDQHSDIRNLPHAEREAAVDTLLQEHYAQLSSQPGFSGEDHRKFRETAQQLRDRVAELKTLKDTAGEGVDMVKEAAKSEATTHVAAAADLSFFDGEGNPRWPAGNMAAQSAFQARNAKDTAQRLAQPTAEKKIDDALAAIHQDIRNGNFPLAPGEEQEKWIDALSASFNPQRQQWFDAVQGPADPTTPEGKKHLSHTQDYTLAHPENRAKILDYIRTGNEERWDELKHNLKKTPQRAQTEEEQENSLKNDPIVRVLNNATGSDWSEDMKGANGAVVGHFVPGMGSATKGGRVGKWVRRGAGVAADIGGTVAQNTIENPDADFEDHKKAVIADYATSLGLKPLQHGAGFAGQKVKDKLQNQSGANNVSPGANYGPNGKADPPGGQTFEERHKLEQGGMQIPEQAAARTPSAQDGIPVHTTKTARAAREAWEKDGGKALQTIDRLKTKAKEAPLSAEEQHELNQAEKLQANVRVANLETEQQNRPQGLDPVKAQALETERAILQKSASGEQPPGGGGGAGEPAAVPAGQDASPPQPMNGGAGNGGKGGGESPPLPPPPSPSEGQPSKNSRPQDQDAAPAGAGQKDTPVPTFKEFGQAQKTVERLKAQDVPLTPDQQRELDTAEKTMARKTEANILEQKAALEKRGEKIHDKTAQKLAEAQATLARPTPGGGTLRSDDSGRNGNVFLDTTKKLDTPADPSKPPSPKPMSPDPAAFDPAAVDPVRHQEHRDKYERKRAEPRDAEAQAELKAREAPLLHPETGVDATRTRIQKAADEKSFRKGEEISGKHVNAVDHLKADDGLEVVHKPRDGQEKKKIRAGISPETTGHREVAASKIAQILGIDLVPATTMITHEGQPGSAQLFKGGDNVVDGRSAISPPHNVKIDAKNRFPKELPDDAAHDWQLMDDLLMHGDRHEGNYMLHLNGNRIAGVSLVDNGHVLPANTGVVKKRFLGPREGQPISPLNQERLHRMLDNEKSLRQSLKDHLEPEAIDGLLARAKALLARGRYGNFTLDEINAHLPPEKHRVDPVPFHDIGQ